MLHEADFRQTVILVGVHNGEGALGTILNRPLALTVGQAFPGLAPLVGAEAPMYRGGPVQPEAAVLLAELARPELADLPVFGAVGFLVGDVSPDVQPHLLRSRVFAGYAGWGPGQLESELEAGAWFVAPATSAAPFTAHPKGLWGAVLQRMGPDFARMARIPFDPRVN